MLKRKILLNRMLQYAWFTRHTQFNLISGTPTLWANVGYFNIHIPVYLV